MMPSFKSLGNKMLGGIKKRSDPLADNDSGRSAENDSAVDLQSDSPEAIASRSVKAFCESGGPGNTGDEVTLLPPIVESAESSPAAAAECARVIRRFLKKDYWSKPTYQYNALMLMRILADNPGPTFTRNFDAKVVETLKDLLRNGRDLSVRQMLMETLESWDREKGWDEGMGLMIEMWKKEKEKASKAYGPRGPPPAMPQNMTGNAPFNPNSQNYFARAHNNKRLPDPVELANRLEEARTSAKLLTSLVANTPSTEVLENELVKEFADRCLSASRSIQGYMTAENPGPDNETMESLIDVNEELQQALNSQKRAVLSARKELGIGDRSENTSPQPPEVNGFSRPPAPAASGAFAGAPSRATRPANGNKGKGRQDQEMITPPAGPPPGWPSPAPVSPLEPDEEDNPFRDPQNNTAASSAAARGKAAAGGSGGSQRRPLEEPSLDREPFHPGFNQPTQSYLGRQDSAMNKIQMHGAGANDEGNRYTTGGSSSARNRGYGDENEDIYNASENSSSRQGGGAYRY